MKREELKELGLTDEQIGSIMALHGVTVNELNSRVSTAEQQATQYQEQLEKNQNELNDFKANAKGNEDLTKQLEDLQSRFDEIKTSSEQQIADLKKSSAIDLALTQAGAKNIKAAKALLDSESLELTDEGLKGLDDQLAALKESDGYLFGQSEQVPPNPDGKKATFSGNASSGQNVEEDAFAKALGVMPNKN
ncbi:phage scaffolding protein [Enterococcus faecium]|uniref:phage scaffolding protein n=1 Tax=Enterococcus faecium TaxID=1352 RepID=UPI00207473C0|nr:phage scaffolding protein [Enterococcus faecium]MCM6871265.1 phage scaffolding protein [Enterococcus faecium]MCM6876866.1 phage scaffolding protein [Enterococcus faecium]MCM6887857.1 phage scaffolding protein [Enterococcus faecium]MCM6890315.1 phage scaffolding protein [Enterococcus faecium]MCM6910897.1 phage scaffolding protein [Enterococcus faecium]